MRPWSLISLLAVCTGCNARLVRAPIVGKVSLRATAHVDVHVSPTANVIVPLQGAPVPEFFGIPLDGAQDVVFVLDTSGSMNNLARGQIAQIRTQDAPLSEPPPPTGPPQDAGPMTPPPSVGPAPDGTVPPRPPGPPPGSPPPPPMGYPPDSRPQAAPPPPPPPTTTTTTYTPTKIEVARAELIAAVEQLPAGTRLNVVFFNQGLAAFNAGMTPLDETSRANLITFVKETAASGSTALAPAMRAAFLMNASRVVLLSDGLGNVGGGADAVLRDAREAMRGGVRIDTIGLGSGQDASLMSTLAQESGGLYQNL